MANQKKVAPTLNETTKTKLNSFKTSSAKIRFLEYNGYEKADIARIVGCRYQMVRNILNQNVKVPNEAYKVKIKQ